jgi:hypothetical protein
MQPSFLVNLFAACISSEGWIGDTAVTAMTFSCRTSLAMVRRRLESTPPEKATTVPGNALRIFFIFFNHA